MTTQLVRVFSTFGANSKTHPINTPQKTLLGFKASMNINVIHPLGEPRYTYTKEAGAHLFSQHMHIAYLKQLKVWAYKKKKKHNSLNKTELYF